MLDKPCGNLRGVSIQVQNTGLQTRIAGYLGCMGFEYSGLSVAFSAGGLYIAGFAVTCWTPSLYADDVLQDVRPLFAVNDVL